MGKKLLVADDSATIQKVIKLALSSEGYDILAVADGRDAVRAIQEERPDVVLIDVALSNGDAYTVKKAINQDSSLASIRFILMASAFEKVDETAASAARFDARLIKPFDPSHLRKMISDLLKAASSGAALPPSPVNIELTSEAEEQAKEISDFISVTPPTPPPVTPEITVFDGMGEAEETQALTPEEARVLENDIRDLTESTISMSEPEESGWSLNDEKKMRSTRSTETSIAEEKTVELAKTLQKGPLVSVPTQPFDDGGSNFLKIGLDQASKGAEKTRASGFISPRSSTDETPSVDLPNNLGLSSSELENLIQKDVQEVIEKLARELVPKIAESLIRKEIEKILSEP